MEGLFVAWQEQEGRSAAVPFKISPDGQLVAFFRF
jgi:hypothetical protein